MMLIDVFVLGAEASGLGFILGLEVLAFASTLWFGGSEFQELDRFLWGWLGVIWFG